MADAQPAVNAAVTRPPLLLDTPLAQSVAVGGVCFAPHRGIRQHPGDTTGPAGRAAPRLATAGIHRPPDPAHRHWHLSIETMPSGFARHWLCSRFTTTTHHHPHRETAQGNYGLWFTWWGRWIGTERRNNHTRFVMVTGARPIWSSQPSQALFRRLFPTLNGFYFTLGSLNSR